MISFGDRIGHRVVVGWGEMVVIPYGCQVCWVLCTGINVLVPVPPDATMIYASPLGVGLSYERLQ